MEILWILAGWNGVVKGERWDFMAARRVDGMMLGGRRRARTDMQFWSGSLESRDDYKYK